MFSRHRKQLPDNDVRDLDIQQPLRHEEFPRSKYWQRRSKKRAKRIFVADTIPNGSVFGAATTRLGQSDRLRWTRETHRAQAQAHATEAEVAQYALVADLEVLDGCDERPQLIYRILVCIHNTVVFVNTTELLGISTKTLQTHNLRTQILADGGQRSRGP